MGWLCRWHGFDPTSQGRVEGLVPLVYGPGAAVTTILQAPWVVAGVKG